MSRIIGISLGVLFAFGSLSCGKQDTGFVHKRAETKISDGQRVDLIQPVRSKVSDSYVVPDLEFTDDDFTPEQVVGRLDIMVVIDNSGSMLEEQSALSTKFDNLIKIVEGSEWAINVITTDSPCSRAYIKKGSVNPQQRFKTAILAGTSGNGSEKAIEMMMRSLQGECPSPAHQGNNWLRENSTLAVLIVSDEDDSGWGTGNYTVEGAIKYVSGIRKIGRNFRVYGIIDGEGGQNRCAIASQAPKYHELIKKTQGIAGKICAESFEPILKKISENVASILETEFLLNHIPIQNTVTVSVDGKPVPGEYSIDGHRVSFFETPPSGALISVNYAYSEVRSLGLSDKPQLSSMKVFKDQQKMDPSEYYFTGNSNRVAFNQRLIPGSTMEVSYFQDIPPQRSFALGQVEQENKITCEGSSGDPGPFSYDKDSGTITFQVPPPEGSRVSCVVSGVLD